MRPDDGAMHLQLTEEMTMDWRDFQTKLAGTGYIPDPDLAMAIAMTERLQRPILIEGEAGVGKTDVAKSGSEI